MGEIARAVTLAFCYGRPGLSLKKQTPNAVVLDGKIYDEKRVSPLPYCTRNRLSTCLKRHFLSPAPLAVVFERGAHTQDITRNIKHISNDKIKLAVDPETMKCSTPLNRPMCIMLSWLLSKPKHVLKYAELYLDQGYDVISVSCTPWQLMRPMNGVKVVARDLIKFMYQNGDRFVVHGFSVGGYVWSEGLVYAVNNKKLYQPVLDRVEAQVWDSVADLTAVTVGVPFAVFPNNKLLRNTLHATLESYLKVFSSVTAQYKLASDTYYSTPCRAPALFLLSRSDPVGAETNIQNAHDTWLQMGIKCTWKCWENSPHVLHYMHHPEEYRELLLSHLREHTTRDRVSESQQENRQEKKRAIA